MGGGLMQLVAYGAQDIYLTGNPQITFFKVVYRRHTNFSMETIGQTFSGTGKVGANKNTATATISRNGDLIHKMYINCDSPGANTDNTKGSEIVKTAELEIGGQKIDKHWASWNNIWNELSTPESKAIGLKSMQGDIGITGASSGVSSIQVPLNFWFCRNPGLALPLIALQYHEVKVQFEFGSISDTNFAGNADRDLQLMVDYIYLDTDERRRFAQVSHEYLIEQIQKQDVTGGTSQKLIFNHPVKELIWWQGGTPYSKAQLKLNGHDRFSEQKPEYFQLRQPFDYHTAVPRQNLPTAGQLTSNYVTTSTTTAFDNEGAKAAITTAPADQQAVSDSQVYLAKMTNTATAEIAALDSGTNETNLAYVFLTTEIASLSVGQYVLVTLSGTRRAAPTVVTRITQKVQEDTNDGVVDLKSDTTALLFDSLLVDSAVSAVLEGTFSIDKIQILTVDGSISAQARTSQMTNKISVYSFALKPEEHQPSGTCNFSRIDTAILDLTGNDPTNATGEIYAVNYNVLRIMSGMGGLAYSN